jgi:hypothetical protein
MRLDHAQSLLFLGLAASVAACSGDDSNVGGGGILDASSDATSADASLDADAGPDPCADAGSPPSTLECTGLYADFATKQISPSAFAYTPSTPLWSDGAQKQRWIELPPNTQIDRTNPNEWTFPIGTKLFKEFRIGGQRVETRMFQKTKTNFWVYATYAWTPDATAAPINYGGPVPVGTDGGTWNIPTNEDCNECHSGRLDRILGFEEVGLGLPTAQGLTLAQLASQGLLTPAPANVSLSIGDDGTGLNGLSMGWLHVNCGVTCHNANPGAAGQGAGMHLRLDPTQLNGSAPDPAAWDILDTTINVPCISGSLAGEPRIVPGDPTDSVIYQLVNERGTLQMPPIASAFVDVPDVAILRSWITAMGADGGVTDLDGGFDAGDHDGGHHHNDGGGEADANGIDGASEDGGDAAVGDDAGVDAAPDATADAAPDATADAGADSGEDSAVPVDSGDDAGD